VSGIKETEIHKALSPVNLKERGQEHLGIEWSVILKRILKEQLGRTWNEVTCVPLKWIKWRAVLYSVINIGVQ